MRLLWVLLLWVLYLPPAWAGATLDRVRRTGIVTDVLITQYPPFGFIDADNQVAGFDVDVARAFAARLGVKLKIETPSWEAIVSGRWQGRWDLCICSMTPTAERAAVLGFPVEYYASPTVLIVHKDETRIKTVKDLSGKRVGVGMGSSFEKYLDRSLSIPGEPPIAFPFHDVIAVPGDETINLRNLALGPGVRLDAIVASLSTAKVATDSMRSLKILEPVLYWEPSLVATEKGDAEWDRTVANTIAALKADGTLAQISRKWLGLDVTTDVH
jgi:polar amino acid transport system substrate-binding protein